MLNEYSFTLPEESLHEEFFRPSAGAGGQKVNKTQSGVRLFFQPEAAPFLPPDALERLKKLAGPGQMTEEGEIFITVWESRSLLQNRELAKEKLYALIAKALIRPKKRKKTKPTKSSVEKRLQSKKKNSEKKRNRSSFDS